MYQQANQTLHAANVDLTNANVELYNANVQHAQSLENYAKESNEAMQKIVQENENLKNSAASHENHIQQLTADSQKIIKDLQHEILTFKQKETLQADSSTNEISLLRQKIKEMDAKANTDRQTVAELKYELTFLIH
jgi:phage shock protein A